MARSFQKVSITPKGEKSLRSGHPWVYAGEIIEAEDCIDGAITDVFSKNGKWLGAGFYNSASLIRVRILSRNANDRYDREFFRRKLGWAVRYRETVMGDEFASCRLIFGEADGMPGLTVDKYNDVLVTEVASLGIELIKNEIYEDIVGILRKDGYQINHLYERNDIALRLKEGLTENKGFWCGAGLTEGSGEAVIKENGIKYYVNYIDGQKTGYFLDQRLNRRAVADLVQGMTVLDCFTHTGAFALNAASGGANRVTAVDISADALSQAKRNAALNELDDKIEFIKSDVFDMLSGSSRPARGTFDFIILDPPAFTKSSSTVKNAYAGYKDINLRAMTLLNRGGYLATCSCSHFMPEELFRRMLADAAADASVQLREVFHGRQAPDHPILWGVPETDYLKFYIFQVI